MWRVICFLLLIMYSSLSNAQIEEFKKNTVYVEGMGNAVLGSVNYERQLMNKPGLGLRLGIGVMVPDELYLVIPFGVNYLIDVSNQKSFIDVGLSANFNINDFSFSDKIGKNYSKIIPTIGYRRHMSNDWMYRINIMVVKFEYGYIPWAGFAFGKRF